LHRTALRGAALDAAAACLERAVERCDEAGVIAALHPEVGSFIESPSEIETFLERVPVGLCLDTGHTLIGGGGPRALAPPRGAPWAGGAPPRAPPRRWADRILHVHLKAVSGDLLARLRSGAVDVETA